MNAPERYAADELEALPRELQAPVSLWLEHVAEQDGHALLDACRRQSRTADLLKLVAVSEFAGQMLKKHGDWFAAALEAGELERQPEPALALPDGALELDEAAFMRALREARNRALLAILWRDVAGSATVPETLAALSALADDLIVAGARYAGRRFAERHGEIRGPDGAPLPLVVLAMGKLGGRELNFSSDVDLVFLYQEGGESDGERSLPAQQYFARLSRRVVALLEETTADGIVYRVDTRLRPFGDSGPPVVSFAALESYLVNHGRNWERYAYVKARTIHPRDDAAVHEALHRQLIDPFVYRRYLDFGVFESLRDMKSMIAAEVRRRDMADNIKLGPGGIREIEFIVQSLQLVRGGSALRLQRTGLRDALARLVTARGLERRAAAGLDESYCFLRRLENVLQAIRDQQTHELPRGAADRARAALAMGYDDWAGLAAAIARHREFVSGQFAKVAFREHDDEPRTPELERTLAGLCDADAPVDAWLAVFEEHDFGDARDLAEQMHAFLDARSTRQIDATAGKRLKTLLPEVLMRLRTREQPGTILKRLLGILGEVLRRSAYVALLNENAAVTTRLIDLCERSRYLADQIARFPVLLDEILDPRLYAARLSAQSLRDELGERLAGLPAGDSELEIETLAQFQRAARFKIAAADFTGQLPVMKVSDRLTDLAEIVLDKALEVAWRDVTARFGLPVCDHGGRRRVAGLGVVAYGKLGGIELTYRSDLDLVFLHDAAEGTETSGGTSIDANVFFARLARRLVHFLTVQTGSGILYEVDTRLRPSGRSGLLVTSVEAFERYQTENAWTWEHQALLRARAVAGSAHVAREFERVRGQTLTARVNRDALEEDVRAMRERMRAELDNSDRERFDLKQGKGGIGDIEFLVQYLVLRNAGEEPAVIHYSDNIRQLGTLGAAGCLDAGDATRLQDVYRAYRTQVHRLLLNERPAFVGADEFAEERAFVTDLWQRLLGREPAPQKQ